jgi:hypothetical protein
VKITPANISKAVNVSFNKFDHFRRARSKFLNQMVGRHYHGTMAAEKEEKKAAPLNLLHSAVGTLLPNLVYNDPKAMVKTEILMYRPYADLLGLGLNNLVKRINLRMTLRKAILDSIFMAGFIKTGIAAGDNYLSFEGTDIELGQPYAERVDPDDMILDPMARDWDEQNLIGHRFRADPEVLAQTGLYDPDELMRLSSRYEGDTKDSAESLSGNKYDDIREIVKYIDLVEVYLPREKVCVTMPYRREHVTDKFLGWPTTRARPVAPTTCSGSRRSATTCCPFPRPASGTTCTFWATASPGRWPARRSVRSPSWRTRATPPRTCRRLPTPTTARRSPSRTWTRSRK